MLETVLIGSDWLVSDGAAGGNGVTAGRPVTELAAKLVVERAAFTVDDELSVDSVTRLLLEAVESSSVVVVMMTTVGTDTVVEEGRLEKVKSGIDELGARERPDED